MAIALSQILDLVGKLDDSPGEEVARERFRRFLRENVREVGQVRDHVQECLRNSGDQYNRALQDLVNHLAAFLGFEVTFGRYQGVRGGIGFDGHWVSPTGFHVVAEVKTTDAYAIRTASLVGYVDALISEQRIPSWDEALGLYVVGRPDAELRQLENAIVAEKRTQRLRIISIESLLSLAELMGEYDVAHEDILEVLRPSGPSADRIVELMARLVAERVSEETVPTTQRAVTQPAERVPEVGAEVEGVEPAYWLTPVKSDDQQTAEEVVEVLVMREGIYAWGERTPGRKHLKPGDWMCFYATGTGVIGHAKVTSTPVNQQHPSVRDPERYPWVFRITQAEFYPDNPVVIDADLRGRLDRFEGRDPNAHWAWFVQATCKIDEHDFRVLTRQ